MKSLKLFVVIVLAMCAAPWVFAILWGFARGIHMVATGQTP